MINFTVQKQTNGTSYRVKSLDYDSKTVQQHKSNGSK